MASYSEFEGVPIHVFHEVLTTLLRERSGFTGTVVSDYVGVGWAQTRQRVSDPPEEVGALALAAGMDVELPVVHGYGQVLVKAVESGKVSVPPGRVARARSLEHFPSPMESHEGFGMSHSYRSHFETRVPRLHKATTCVNVLRREERQVGNTASDSLLDARFEWLWCLQAEGKSPATLAVYAGAVQSFAVRPLIRTVRGQDFAVVLTRHTLGNRDRSGRGREEPLYVPRPVASRRVG
jgi:beta-glucosidase-like glycosyl hydrolase